MSWDYEATPPPQRPHSLAWEIRKSNPAPRMRTKSLSSPAASGKSSPSFSGKNSPCHVPLSANSSATEISLIQIKEIPEDIDQNSLSKKTSSSQTDENTISEEITAGFSLISKIDAECQTDLDDDNLTLAEYLEKYKDDKIEKVIFDEEKSDINVNSAHESIQKLVKDDESKKNQDVFAPDVIPKFVSPKLDKKKPIQPKYSTILNRSTTASNFNTVVKPKLTGARNVAPPARITPSNVQINKKQIPNGCTVQIKTASNSRNEPIKSQSQNLKSSQLQHRINEQFPTAKISNRLTARSKTMIVMTTKSKNSPSLNCSTSTLVASNEQLSSSSSRKSEPKNIPSSDGWLTVKTRRRSSLHWANRFNQPTGYASLPTLSLLNENETNLKPEINLSNEKSDLKTDSSSDEKKKDVKKKNGVKKAPEKSIRESKLNSVLSIKKQAAVSISEESQQHNTSIKRQKSDLTGLKLKALRKEFLRLEKAFNKEKVNKLDEKSSSLSTPELISDQHKSKTILAEHQRINLLSESDIHEKVDMNIQTTPMFSDTVQKLYSMCNQCDEDEIHDNPSPLSLINQSLSSCDELEEHDAENDENQRKLLEEQESLERQIRELENAEIDVDTETDETDCEVTIDLDSEVNDDVSNDNVLETDENISLEMRYQAFLSDMTIGERVATLATLQALVARHPGRAQELHQKLSSPSRRRSLHETLKKYQAKQARAQEMREILQKEKSFKIQQLLTRVEDVKAAKQQLIEEKRLRMEERLQRAAENRSQFLKDKVRKAHDEEEKLREIAFIKNIEAQNKRLDFLESFKEYEVRMQDLEQERQKKVEEKAAKEAAAGRRRFELERERQRKLEKLRETRREREKRIGLYIIFLNLISHLQNIIFCYNIYKN